MSSLALLWVSIGGLSPWVTVVAIGAAVIVLLAYVLEPVRENVWTPWTVTRHMRKQGYSGPPFSLLANNDREMSKLTVSAGAEPFHLGGDLSHDFMPRVLAPFHTWRNLYGKHSSSPACPFV